MNAVDMMRERAARRTRAARLAAQNDVLRKWGAAGLDRAGLTPDTISRAATTLFRTGMPLYVAERVVQEALEDAAAAFRAGLLRHGTDQATDSENTDTGRLRKV